jgi:heat shock protein HtpX
MKSRLIFQDEISKNKRNSFFLIVIIFLVFLIFGYVISLAFDPGFFFIIMIIAIIISMIYILVSYYNSDKIAIASVRAKKASRTEYKLYYDIVEGISLASGLPIPRLYIMPSEQINAFASGRNPDNAVICVTKGALDKLDRRELEGVLAHEMSHIANYDMRYMTLVAVMVGMIAIISEIFLRSLWFRNFKSNDSKGNFIFIIIGIIMAILAPIIVKLVQLSISRKREYGADSTAVKFTRYPKGLLEALKKIKLESNEMANSKNERVSKALAPLFFSNPIKGWTSTHPPLDDRIKKLEKM